MRTLDSVDLKGKRVLVRVDFNVPIDKNGNIRDDFKIKNTVPTIRKILKDAKQVILMSHLGRPKGVDSKLKMDKVAVKLMKHLGKNVAKLDDCIDVDIPDEKVVMLENLRFHKEEKANNPIFAKKLASYADFYVNDAFAVSHRAHASVVGVAEFLPSCAGLLLEDEIKKLTLENAEKPLMVIMGGSKLSTKFPVMNALLPKVDKLLVGGAMIFTFYKAKGLEIGKSMIEKDQVVTASILMNNENIVLPEDVMIAKDTDSKGKKCAVDKIPKSQIGLDVGPESIKLFENILSNAKTIFWNGPLGYYENPEFAKGSEDLARFLSECDAKVIIGGGDSAAIVEKLGLEYYHVSTGGGASLEYIQNGTLPGIEVLK